MSKRQLIDEIGRYNPTALRDFLSKFSEHELQEYLDHLKAAQSKRIHIHGWVKKRDGMRIAS
jgi:hypothetical protein